MRMATSDMEVKHPTLPEARLLAAVLGRAIHDVVRDEERESALFWIRGGYEDPNGLTFEFVCEALDLDGPTIRRNVEAIVENEKKRDSRPAMSEGHF